MSFRSVIDSDVLFRDVRCNTLEAYNISDINQSTGGAGEYLVAQGGGEGFEWTEPAGGGFATLEGDNVFTGVDTFSTANIFHLGMVGPVYDITADAGDAGDVLTSTGDGAMWTSNLNLTPAEVIVSTPIVPIYSITDINNLMSANVYPIGSYIRVNYQGGANVISGTTEIFAEISVPAGVWYIQANPTAEDDGAGNTAGFAFYLTDTASSMLAQTIVSLNTNESVVVLPVFGACLNWVSSSDTASTVYLSGDVVNFVGQNASANLDGGWLSAIRLA